MPKLITEEEVDAALHYLRDSAFQIGKARERLVLADHMVKHIEALMFLASEEGTVEAKKQDVKRSKKWMDAAREEAEAAGDFEKLKALREAALARLDCWRTESATLRGMKT